LEIIKDRLYNPEKRGADKRRGAQFSLYRAGLNVIIMFAPFMPHITEEIYQEQFRNHEKEISIHRLRWSQVIEVPGDNQKLLQAGNGVIEILGYARRYKASQKLSMKAEIPILELTLHPETLTLIEPAFDDLRAVGNIMEIRIVESTEKFKVKVLLPETGFPEFEFNI
jgi:valyl-tRNA synthetase